MRLIIVHVLIEEAQEQHGGAQVAGPHGYSLDLAIESWRARRACFCISARHVAKPEAYLLSGKRPFAVHDSGHGMATQHSHGAPLPDGGDTGARRVHRGHRWVGADDSL